MEYKSIPDMIRQRTSLYQNRDAMRFFNAAGAIESKSWNTMTEEFTRLSRVLLAQDFDSGDNIGIFSQNIPKWTITELAILNIRAVVVPFFATASRDQCKYIIDETGMRMLFAGDQPQLDIAIWLLDNTSTLKKVVVFNDALDLSDPRCVSFGSYINSKMCAPPQLEAQQQPATVDDLATIIYTSGTTGEPKGVMLSHDNFLYSFSIHHERLDVTDKDVSMTFLPLSHIFERTWTLLIFFRGATNFYLSNPKEIIQSLPKAQPTVMCTVPRFFEKTYDGIQDEYQRWPATKRAIFRWAIATGYKVIDRKKHNQALPLMLSMQHKIADRLVLKKLREIFGGSMRTMPCSGASLPIHLLRFFSATGVFINYGYGATETTATVSCFKADHHEFESCGSIMPGIELRIGEKSEILVRGRTVFSGYYKKPEATAESLTDGWYHTGDEGALTSAGNLVMHDRLKDLMKTSIGKYVSPQKIETLLNQEPLFEQVVVFGDNRKFITAIIIPVMDRMVALAQKWEIKYADYKDLLLHERIRSHVLQRIETLQSELANYEKIREFTLLSEPFSIESQTLTSTLKTRRRAIEIQYADVIASMYHTREGAEEFI
ncbi:MAG TPA: long-chain fatty acid--CoA ligase [Bacteroidales bacterium]|nr:long-chain fatty acid--CoA ligase [Bacteroidales bacterium]